MNHSQTQPASEATRKSKRGLAWNIVGAAAFGCLIDGTIFTVSKPDAAPVLAFPPPWVIGSVWVVLFGLMGAARWLVKSTGPRSSAASVAVTLLLLFCASYPFYTKMLQDVRTGLIGNGLTIASALVVAVMCWRRSRKASFLVLITAVWVVFATYLTLKA